MFSIDYEKLTSFVEFTSIVRLPEIYSCFGEGVWSARGHFIPLITQKINIESATWEFLLTWFENFLVRGEAW